MNRTSIFTALFRPIRECRQSSSIALSDRRPFMPRPSSLSAPSSNFKTNNCESVLRNRDSVASRPRTTACHAACSSVSRVRKTAARQRVGRVLAEHLAARFPSVRPTPATRSHEHSEQCSAASPASIEQPGQFAFRARKAEPRTERSRLEIEDADLATIEPGEVATS
jgi:hypothetical protein